MMGWVLERVWEKITGEISLNFKDNEGELVYQTPKH